LGLPPKRKGRAPTAGHGSRGKYTRGCRCDACTAAQARYQASWKAKREAGKTTPRRKALASELTRSRRAPTGHGSLARAKAGCDCPRCEEALVNEEAKQHPNGPPRWRCGCDAYRVNPGEALLCSGCGQPKPWASVGQPERRTA
jgi:hypothetical protein